MGSLYLVAMSKGSYKKFIIYIYVLNRHEKNLNVEMFFLAIILCRLRVNDTRMYSIFF